MEEIQKINEIWNSVFEYDPTSMSQLERKFFNNEYIEPIYPIVRKEAFSLLGKQSKDFIYEKMRKEDAWILAAASKNKIYLKELLDTQISKLDSIGIKRIHYSGFSPGYFFPGIDKEKYPCIFQTFADAGFKVDDEVISMEAEIGSMKYYVPNDSKLSVLNLCKQDVEDFLNMVSQNFPADCFFRCRGVISKGNLEQISVAKMDSNLVGYSMYASGEGPFEFSPGERFGCFEVLEKYRSLGVGSKLLAKTLINMKSNGIRHAYFLSTSEKASHLYERFGFKVTRKFQVLTLRL